MRWISECTVSDSGFPKLFFRADLIDAWGRTTLKHCHLRRPRRESDLKSTVVIKGAFMNVLARKTWFAFTATMSFTSAATASETITSEPDESSYHFVSHYSIEIAASADTVWDQLVDVSSWMYEFELSLESGTPGQEGEVRRLYPGQDFFIELTKTIPNELLVFANLPATNNGEYSTGIAVITLGEAEGITTVKLTMNQRFGWDNLEPNPQRALRESPDFQERTRVMWQKRFLGRLRSLVEGE